MKPTLEMLFQEIKTIYRKYGLPKTMGFVPDKLEIVLERSEQNLFNLSYSEHFNYLPDYALETARENAIQLMQQLGFPSEKITSLNHGVKVQIRGSAGIVLYLLLEILLQVESNEREIKAHLDLLYTRYRMFAELMDFYWRWCTATKRKFDDMSSALNEILENHPSFSEEIAQIVKKYSPQTL